MVDGFKALEVTKPCIVTRSRSLSLLLDGVAILPLGVHEGDLVLAHNSGTRVRSNRAEVVIQFVFRSVLAGAGNIEASSSETILSLRHRVHVRRGLGRIDHLVCDSVQMLVEARARQLLRLHERQFVHVKLLAHRVARGFVVLRATEAVAVLVSARSRDIGVAVYVFVNLFHVHFIHVLSTNSE